MRRPVALLIAATLLLAAGCSERQNREAFADYWSAADARGGPVDHAAWQALLERFVIADDDGLNRVDYAGLHERGLDALGDYLDAMAAMDPRTLTRDEQMAYWINLYNALTVRLIAVEWPVRSILDLGDKALGRGPWDDPVTIINGRVLTLNDIEHRILRGLWREPRIHFAVNCASVGCPDLQPVAFSGASLEPMLAVAARQFLASPRGIASNGDTLTLSSLFDWYAEDFGTSEDAVIASLAQLADAQTAALLRNHRGDIRYDYDWSVNGLDAQVAAGIAPRVMSLRLAAL